MDGQAGLIVFVTVIVAAYLMGLVHGWSSHRWHEPVLLRRIRELVAASRRDRGYDPSPAEIEDYLSRSP